MSSDLELEGTRNKSDKIIDANVDASSIAPKHKRARVSQVILVFAKKILSLKNHIKGRNCYPEHWNVGIFLRHGHVKYIPKKDLSAFPLKFGY